MPAGCRRRLAGRVIVYYRTRGSAATRSFWSGWKRVAGVVGNFQARVLLTVFYFTVALPFGVGARLFGDPMGLRRRGPAQGWMPRSAPAPELADLRRQS